MFGRFGNDSITTGLFKCRLEHISLVVFGVAVAANAKNDFFSGTNDLDSPKFL